MQQNSQIYLNDYELPCPSSPPESVPPRKQPSSTRTKSFQDRPERPPREPPEPSREYEVVGGYLQMPSPHNSRSVLNGQRSNSCVEAIPYIGSDRDRDRSKTPERPEKRGRNRTPDRPRNKTPERPEKSDWSRKIPENQWRAREKTPERRDRRNTPERSNRTTTPERRDRGKTPERSNRTTTPERRDRGKTPERRDRAKTPDRSRGSKSRTPDRSRPRSPDSHSERNSRPGRQVRSPPEFPTTVIAIPSTSVTAVSYPPLPDQLQMPAPDSVRVPEQPPSEGFEAPELPLSDQAQNTSDDRRETEPFVFDSDTIKRSDQIASRDKEGRSRSPEEEKYENSSSSGKRRHRHQNSGVELRGESRQRSGRTSRVGQQRTRAYSDSDAENLQESGRHNHPFRYPLAFKHRGSERNPGQIPPIVYRSDNTDMYYRIPFRIPYSNSYEDSDYDNLPRRPTSKSSRSTSNGALLLPGRDSSDRGNDRQELNRSDFTRNSNLNTTKDPAQDFRPYPARFAPPEPSCPYLSETTENEYHTPAEQAAASGKVSGHRRSHSDSSSSRTIMSPWSKSNRILTPKYPLLSTRDQTLTSHDRTLESASQRLSKVKCPVTNNNGNSNMWHDPLLGVDKKHIAHTGETESLQSQEPSQAESFAEFTNDVSMNYLRFIWNSPELIRKLLWAILFLGFFIYSFQCCWRSFSTYFAMPTSTKYNMYFEPNKLLRFPSITICNMNPHNRIYLERDENKPMQAYLQSLSRDPLQTDNKTILVTPSDDKNFPVKNYYRQSGQKLEDFIDNVVFFEEPIKTNKAFREQFTTHGLCWTFNADGSRQVNRTGMDFGLSFSLDINQSIYPDFVKTAGVKLMFHNYYEPALIDEYGLALTPGTENFISLSYERVRNLKAPYGECRDDPLLLYKNYSISGCERQCFTEVMVKECNCKRYYLKDLPGKKYGNVDCSLSKEKSCVERLIKRYHAGELINSTECKCTDPCVSENYLATLSTAEYPAKNHGEALVKNYNKDKGKTNKTKRDVTYYRENLLKVHIYFEILSIKEVEKVGSYKWSNLMGDVGGQLGLFLGANIVTIFEFVDFYLRLLWYNCIVKYFLKSVKRNHNNDQPHV